MRENRTCSSEGGEPGDRASLPYRRDPEFHARMGQPGWGGTDPKHRFDGLRNEVVAAKGSLNNNIDNTRPESAMLPLLKSMLMTAPPTWPYSAE